MHLNPLHLAATGVLILCATLIIRQSDRNGTDTGNAPLPLKPLLSGGPQANTPARKLHERETDGSKPINDVPDPAATVSELQASTPSQQSPPVTNTPGIRLADDVKLPAVILALNAAEKDTLHPVPAPIAAAMRAIVSTFYQELADSARLTPAGAIPDATDTATEDEITILIKPGPAVERARARANETYRALFGDAAFSRATMNATLEVQLPANDAPDGK